MWCPSRSFPKKFCYWCQYSESLQLLLIGTGVIPFLSLLISLAASPWMKFAFLRCNETASYSVHKKWCGQPASQPAQKTIQKQLNVKKHTSARQELCNCHQLHANVQPLSMQENLCRAQGTCTNCCLHITRLYLISDSDQKMENRLEFALTYTT